MCVWLGDWVSMRVCECEWMSEQMMYEHVWASEWVRECLSEWLNDWVVERWGKGGLVKEWVSEGPPDRMNERLNEWMNEQTSESHILFRLGCFNHFDVNISVQVLLIPIT